MSERLEFRYSPRGQLGLIGVGCALVAVSWFVAVTHPDVVYRTIGWLGAGFFALCIVIAAKRLLSGGVPFVFDLSGITFPTGSFGLLPWAEIKSYAVVTVRGNHFLAITFHDPARILSRVSAAKRKWASANQRLGWGHWALSFAGLTPGMDEAIAFIREHQLIQPAA
ncbi:MAG TPA: STM3941 family protein [Thermoanaerobaculia bacterium]|jgi:hypothetical protein|nr:STM3941 family protein [Thermoanaerobaculia bacterium]